MLSSIKRQYQLWQHRNLLQDFPVCFIVSTGRTGTKFFESFFSELVPSVYCAHEPAPDLFDLGVGLFRGKILTRQAVRALRRSRLSMLLKATQSGQAIYIESNPNASLLLPQIKVAFPNYRILWITRDIKTYLPSAYNKSPEGSGDMYLYGQRDHRQRLTALDIPDDPWRSEWKTFSRPERIAWWWQKCNRLILDYCQDDDRCLKIRFEDLFTGASGADTVRKILSFLRLDNTTHIKESDILRILKKKQNKTKETLLRHFEELSDKERTQVQNIAGSVAEKLGYGFDT